MPHILVESSYGSIWREIMEGITWFVGEQRLDWQINCVTTGELTGALKMHPDGAICLLRHGQRALARRLIASRMPMVNILRDIDPRIGCVMSDNELIGARAAEYLHGQGFRDFRFVGVDRAYSVEREAGFRRRLEELGRVAATCPVPISVDAMRTVKSAGLERKLERWLGSLPRPAAIFTCADFVARQIMDCCRRIGISVPEDAAVLGVDNDLAICDLTSPRLSSIPQNMRRIGFDAARLLHGIMKGRRRPRAPVLIPPREVVVRQSTDSIVVEDARLAAVLRRIRSPERGEQSLRTLAKEAGMSRQWLDRRFRESLGATPSELIRRRKLAVARSLLIETHLPIQTIARRAGFTCGENLSRFFRQHMGMSPGEYRLRHGFVE